MLSRRCRFLPIVFVTTILTLSGPAVSDEHTTPQAVDTTAATCEGPYVLWLAPDSARVFYLSGDEIIQEDFKTEATLSFSGLCDDSLIAYTIPTAPWLAEPAEYSGVDKIFAVSDLHGEYEAFEDILRKNGLIDDQLHWKWGKGHLVIDGDVFDRGDRVTETLWLIYRLEQEARAQGGRVHLLLGNHELMVLRGDERYVNEKYTGGIVKKSRISYQDLFGPAMELGRWLRSRPTVIRLNDVLFVHGGLEPKIADGKWNLATLNRAALQHLDDRSYDLAFGSEAGYLYGSYGPFWYRGWLMENKYPQETPEQVRHTLEYFGATRAVVGHSEIEHIEPLQEGLIIGIDVPVEDLGGLEGLLIENGRFYRVSVSGQKEPLL